MVSWHTAAAGSGTSAGTMASGDPDRYCTGIPLMTSTKERVECGWLDDALGSTRRIQRLGSHDAAVRLLPFQLDLTGGGSQVLLGRRRESWEYGADGLSLSNTTWMTRMKNNQNV